MYILFVFSLLYHVALHCILYLLYGTVTKVEHLWVAINANLSSIVSKKRTFNWKIFAPGYEVVQSIFLYQGNVKRRSSQP